MTTKFVERKTHLYKINDLFDDNNKILFLHPEQIVLDIYDYEFDIGSWYYSVFHKSKLHSIKVNLVDVSSYEKDRDKFIVAVLRYVYRRRRMKIREITILSQIRSLEKFYRWCDENKRMLLNNFNFKYAKEAYLKYTDYLLIKVRKGVVSSIYASRLQQETVSFFNSAIPGSNLEFETIKIAGAKGETKNAEPANNTNELSVIYEQLFNQFTDFVIDVGQYPFKFQVKKDFMWCVPMSHNAFKNERNKGTAFDFNTGKIKSLEEVLKTIRISKYTGTIDKRMWYAKNKIDTLNEKISLANKDKYHSARLRLAALASDSFIMMFLLNTGMNHAQMLNLPWDGGTFDETRDDINYKSIKYRANGKQVEFKVGSTFVSKFKKYLKLREFMLNANNIESFDYLFFEYRKKNFRKIKTGVSDFNEALISHFNISEVATARQLRSFKNNTIQDISGDYSQTAVMMQHSKEVARESYHNGSLKNQTKEMTDFFNHLSSNIVVSDTEKTTDITYGLCKDVSSPVFDKGAVIEPDCVNSKGCLFCKQFAVHADHDSYKKLLKLEMLINKSRILANNNHHESLFRPLYDRINLYKSAIVDQSKMTLDDIELCRKEVTTSKPNTFFMRTLNLIYELA